MENPPHCNSKGAGNERSSLPWQQVSFGLYAGCCFTVSTFLGLIPTLSDGLCLFPLFLQSNETERWTHVVSQKRDQHRSPTSPSSSHGLLGGENEELKLRWLTASEDTEGEDRRASENKHRDWRGGIREQGMKFDYRVQFNGSIMSLTVEDSNGMKSPSTVGNDGDDPPRTNYLRECVDVVDNNRYLVRHRSIDPLSTVEHSERRANPGDQKVRGKDDTPDQLYHTSFYYACVQFIRRSSTVFQLRTSQIANYEDVSLCFDDRMSTDRWLFVDYAVEPESELHAGLETGCSLRGGFSMRIFESRSRSGSSSVSGVTQLDSSGVCSEARVESDCDRGSDDNSDGMHFHFRSNTCVPRGLYMYANQRTICLASWTDADDRFSYTVLRHDRLEYRWLLRHPTVLVEDSFVAHLFADLVADNDGSLRTSTELRDLSHWRLDIVRDVPRPVTSLCVDESEACHVWNVPPASVSMDAATKRRQMTSPCARQMALACPRSCNICNESRPVVCSFRSELLGEWIAMSDSGEQTLKVVVNASTIAFTPHGSVATESFYCVTWSANGGGAGRTSSSSYPVVETMLVTETFDGCRPRYVCLRYQRQSSSLIYMLLSRRRSWPLISTADQSIDCRSFSFDAEVDSDASANRSPRSQLFYSREPRDPVACRLPSSVSHLVNYTMTYLDGTQCLHSELAVGDSSQSTSFKLTIGPCSSYPGGAASAPAVTSTKKATTYLCSKSTLLGPTPSSDGVVIIARSAELPVNVQCVVAFEKPEPEVYWLRASECASAMRRRLRRERMSPIAVLSSSTSRASLRGVGSDHFRRRSDGDAYRRVVGDTLVTRSPVTSRRMPPSLAFGRTETSLDAEYTNSSTFASDDSSNSNIFPEIDEIRNNDNGRGAGNGTIDEILPETTNVFVLLAALVVFALLHIPCNLCNGS